MHGGECSILAWGPRAATLGAWVFCVAAMLAAPALAASSDRNRPARIVAPKPGALVRGDVITVRVRAREPLSGLTAAVSSNAAKHTDVTGRFRPAARDGIWRARLRRGHELAIGRNYLYVRVRTEAGELDVTASTFTVIGKRADLVSVRRPRVGTETAPVGARIALKAGRVRVLLNGRNVTGAFERRGDGRLLAAELTVHHGLRFGHNRLGVTAYTREKGRYERVTRRFRVRRDRPLADAGLDHTAPVGTPLRLDGRKTRRARRGAPLALRWRVMEKPDGSNPTLARARTARPRLVTDVNGHYTIALRARGPGARGGPTGSDRRGRLTPGKRSTVDAVTVAAQPNALPSGVALETNAPNPDNPDGAYGITLDGEFYPPVWGAAGGGPQLMILDRETLAVQDQNGEPTQTFGAGNQGAAGLEQALEQLTSDELAVVTGGGRAINLSSNGEQTMAAAVGLIGAQITAAEHETLASGEWSVVGIPGIPEGQAYQLIGRQQGADARPGAISGFLQLDSNDNYAFTWPPEYAPFDTQAPSSTATTNVIAVGSDTYPSWSIEPNVAGLQVIWLAGDTLELKGTATYFVYGCAQPGNVDCETYKCDSPPPSGPPECLETFVFTSAGGGLDSIAADPDALILMTTIGQPTPSLNGAWGFAAEKLASFGVNQLVMLGYSGGDYSFVGVNGLGDAGPNRGAELANQFSGLPSPRLSGVLSRNRQGLLEPQAYGSPGPTGVADITQPDLQKILAEPPEPFPAFSTPGEQAAESYIAERLDLALDPEYGIRANYWQDESIAWSVYQNELSNMPACTTSPCDQGFADVQSQLLTEFGMVDQVITYFTGGGEFDLYGALEGALLGTGVNITGIGEGILSLYDQPPGHAYGVNPLGIMGGILTIGSGFGGAIPGVGGVTSAPFKIAAGTTQIIEATTTTSGGSALYDPAVFQQTELAFTQELATSMTKALENLGHISSLLVSDWNRLQAANQQIATTPEDGGWGLNSNSVDALQTAIDLNMRRYMWSSLLPVPFFVAFESEDTPGCDPNFPINCEPPTDANVLQNEAFTPETNQTPFWFYMCRSGTSHTYPAANILETLFSAPTTTVNSPTSKDPLPVPALGFQKQNFYAPAVTDANGNAISPGFLQKGISFQDGQDKGEWC